MSPSKYKLRYVVLVLSLILVISGIAMAASVQNNNGSVIVSEIDVQAEDGSMIHCTLQRPVYATSTNKLPGVVVYHGVLQSKEWLMAFGIELARRGFVVLTADANGHGNSDPGTGGGPATLEFLASLAYVNQSAIGIIGHSMGGGTAWRAITKSSVETRAFVVVGSSIRSEWNVTYPRNLLFTVGEFDSLFTIPKNTTPLEPIFNTTNVEEGALYGDFKTGTARKLVVARTNHLFETIDPKIISETVEWMRNSLESNEEYWIPKNILVYHWWLIGGFLSTVGILLSIFPLLTILIDLPFFVELKKDPTDDQIQQLGMFSKWAILYSLVPILLYYPLFILGSMVPFPQLFGMSISIWVVGIVVILFLILGIYSKSQGITWKRFLKLPGSENRKRWYVKTIILTLVVIVWLYLWTLLVDIGFALDFRCFLPGLNDLTALRALFVPWYAIIFFIYFLIDSMWLMGPLKPRNLEPWYKGLLRWSGTAAFLKCYPFVVLLGIEFGIGALFGVVVFPGLIGFSFLFFYAFIPWFLVSAIITTWMYRTTDSHYLGALLNSLLFAWVLAETLAFGFG